MAKYWGHDYDSYSLFALGLIYGWFAPTYYSEQLSAKIWAISRVLIKSKIFFNLWIAMHRRALLWFKKFSLYFMIQ